MFGDPGRRLKRLKETLAYLGESYVEKVIDGERCPYRDFGTFDVEVSGANYTSRKVYRIYLWEKKCSIVWVSRSIKKLEELAAVLSNIEQAVKDYDNSDPDDYFSLKLGKCSRNA